jgi:hypothetical protein
MIFLPRNRSILFCKTTPLLLVAMLQACIFVPKTREIYDADCRIFSRQAVLEHTEIVSLGRCRNADCIAVLALAGVVSATTAVISGSIVVAGNTVYWLEKQGRCNRVSNPAALAPTDGPASVE